MSTTHRDVVQESMAAGDTLTWWYILKDEPRAQPRDGLCLALGYDRTAAGTGG